VAKTRPAHVFLSRHSRINQRKRGALPITDIKQRFLTSSGAITKLTSLMIERMARHLSIDLESKRDQFGFAASFWLKRYVKPDCDNRRVKIRAVVAD